MHRQAIIIKPPTIGLEDVMYPYQEVDKDVGGKLEDRRCFFKLKVPIKDIQRELSNIVDYYIQKREECHEQIIYRSTYTGENYDYWIM